MAIKLPQSIPFPLLREDAPHTTAELAYFSPPPNGETPYQRMYESDLPKTNIERVKIRTPIYDLRPLVDAGRAKETNIDVTGFQVVPREVGATSMKESDWEKDDVIRSVYYREVEELVKKVTGATKVIIFDHTIRKVERPGFETPDTPESRKPVNGVHIDQTPASGLKRVYRHAGEDAERLLKGRAQLVNIWRPLRGPVLDEPLGVADARTLQDSHLVKSRLIYEPPAPEGETFAVAHSDEHRWYYLSNMVPDEALLLKCWDSAEDGGARTPHSGFKDDKYVGRDVELPRQSVEVRTLIFYEDEK